MIVQRRATGFKKSPMLPPLLLDDVDDRVGAAAAAGVSIAVLLMLLLLEW
jgi:hypothetical protein